MLKKHFLFKGLTVTLGKELYYYPPFYDLKKKTQKTDKKVMQLNQYPIVPQFLE